MGRLKQRPVSGLAPEMLEAAGRFHRSVTRSKKCVQCGRGGRLEAHHVVPKQNLKREVPAEQHLEVLYDPRNGMALCQICHHGHESAMKRIPRKLVPASAWQFAAEHELTWLIESRYPEE